MRRRVLTKYTTVQLMRTEIVWDASAVALRLNISAWMMFVKIDVISSICMSAVFVFSSVYFISKPILLKFFRVNLSSFWILSAPVVVDVPHAHCKVVFREVLGTHGIVHCRLWIAHRTGTILHRQSIAELRVERVFPIVDDGTVILWWSECRVRVLRMVIVATQRW